MKRFLLLLTAAVSFGQAPAVPTDLEARKLYERALQLMESAGLANPDLGRAGIPLAENARLSLELLKTASGQPPTVHQRFLTNLRAFLLLSDAVPKPPSMTDEAKRQMEELRSIHTRLEAYFDNLLDQLYKQLNSPDRDNMQRYADANATIGAPKAGRPRVVFFGDSITDRWRLNEYFPDRDFVNRGISGQITSQMLARFLNDVAALKPAAVLILAGTNDISRGVTLPVIEANLTAMADLAARYDIKVIFASVLPVSDYHRMENPLYERTRLRPPDVIRALNNWIFEFCRDRGYTYLNYWPALADEAGFIKKDLAADGLHPDGPGYRLMAPLALASIEKTLKGSQPSRPARRP